MKDLIEDLSCHHSRGIILACQETWRYELPRPFQRQLGDKYFFLHESAMDARKKKKSGRPFGGISLIISKSIAFRTIYSSSRCMSILLCAHNIVLNNIYLPAVDSRKSVEDNYDAMLQGLSHLEAAHELSPTVDDYIAVGDFNCTDSDSSRRANLVKDSLRSLQYVSSDLMHLSSADYSHESGRLIDRIVSTPRVSEMVLDVSVLIEHHNSDHHPVVGTFKIPTDALSDTSANPTRLNWKNATEAAIQSYSNLASKLCEPLNNAFENGSLNGVELYKSLVSSLDFAARTCIPKYKKNTRPQHNIPLWRERIGSFKNEVDYWLQLQFLHGGPNLCPYNIRTQLRLAKSRYKLQLRHLRREISINVAEKTTMENVYRQQFRTPKSPSPCNIEGFSRAEQPAMWADHFNDVFKGETAPYDGEMLNDIPVTTQDIEQFDYINLDEVNSVISNINTNKSYERHYHWKHLNSNTNHSAKLCLTNIMNFWIHNALTQSDQPYFEWDFFFI